MNFLIFMLFQSLYAGNNCEVLNVDLREAMPPIFIQCAGTCYSHQVADLATHALKRKNIISSNRYINPYSPFLTKSFQDAADYNSLYDSCTANLSGGAEDIIEKNKYGFLFNDQLKIKKCSELNELISSMKINDQNCKTADYITLNISESENNLFKDVYKGIAAQNMDLTKDLKIINIYSPRKYSSNGPGLPIYTKEEKIIIDKKINKVLKEEKPLGIYIDYDLFKNNVGFRDSSDYSGGMGHAISIVGKVGCSYILRNSYGVKSCQKERTYYNYLPTRQLQSLFDMKDVIQVENDFLKYIEKICKLSVIGGTSDEHCFDTVRLSLTSLLSGETSEKKLISKARKNFSKSQYLISENTDIFKYINFENKPHILKMLESISDLSSFNNKISTLNPAPFDCTEDGYYIVSGDYMIDFMTDLFIVD